MMSESRQPLRKASPFQVAKTVLSAFIGIRRRAAHERDAVTISPVQAIIAGLIAAAVFVFCLVMLARFVTS
ncbi:MAG: DUF2970 domain-containing protein [Burkholderiales bacterium]|nr:DUF2970 domain-containing protein [Burkholderiales bacterium]